MVFLTQMVPCLHVHVPLDQTERWLTERYPGACRVSAESAAASEGKKRGPYNR